MNALRCEREVTEQSGGTEERSPRCIRQRRGRGVRKNAFVHPRGIFYNIFEFLRSHLLTKRSFDGIIKSQQNMMTRTGRPRGTNNLKGRLLSWVGSLQA